jgi:hypothetical protein
MIMSCIVMSQCSEDNSNPVNTNTLIGTPSNPSPENDAVEQHRNLFLSWNSIYDSLTTISYDIYFGTSNDPPIYQQDLNHNYLFISSLLSGTKYYWKVVSKISNTSIPSDIWSFTTSVDTSSTQSPSIYEFNLSTVSLDTLTKYVNELSGEITTTINGNSTTITTREKTHPDNALAARYLVERMSQFNLNVIEQKYSASGNNILVLQPAEGATDYVLFGAHYDSIVMGADDNASGVAVTMEAVRLLHKFTPKKNIIYVFWDEEEYAGYGSKYFVDSAKTANMGIDIVMNMDMIAYDNNNDNAIYIYSTEEQGNDLYLSILKNVNTVSNLDLLLLIKKEPMSSEDYEFFHTGGYKTLAIGEGGEPWNPDTLNDFSPYWHTDQDKIEHFNFDFFEKNAKLAIGTLVEIAFKN